MRRTAIRMIVGAAVAMFALPLSAQSSRDSGGVLIVENTRPAWTDRERLEVAAKPRLKIGDNRDTSYRFLRIEGALTLTDGRIVAVDVALRRLRIFDRQGRFLSSDGSGPWQVPGVHWVRLLRGDTIAVRTGFATLMLFSSAGGFVKTVQLPPSDESKPEGRFFLQTVLTSGLGVATQSQRLQANHPVGTQFVESRAIRLVTDSDSSGRELDTLPMLAFEQGVPGVSTVWLAPTSALAAADDRFYHGFGDQYLIRGYSADGKLKSIIRRAWTPVPITDDLWEQWVEASTDRLGRMTGQERIEQMQQFRTYPRAKQLPAFSQIIIDKGGRLWVREPHWQEAIGTAYFTQTPSVPSTWSVFDVRGRWLGDVSMPAGFKPFEIGADYVLGSLRSEGVMQVVIFDLGVRK